MIKSDIFVADAHIENKDSDCAKNFIKFLDHIKGSTRTLYILGDLFDFWFGENDASFALYQPILDKFRELARESVKIVYFEGNHDFFMGSFFEDILKADIYSDGATINIEGKNTFLTHGDTINQEDNAYLLWRKMLRSRFMFYLMKSLPMSALTGIATWLSKKSRNSRHNKKLVKPAMIEEFADGMIEKGFHAVVFAHTHSALLEKRSGAMLVNPGAFSDNGSYAQYKDGEFSLKNFTLQ